MAASVPKYEVDSCDCCSYCVHLLVALNKGISIQRGRKGIRERREIGESMNTTAAITHRALAPLDMAIIGVYFLIVFCIGVYFARKARTATGYFLASRDVGWFFIGASLFVSNISTEHFIGLSGTGASSGLAVGHFEWLAWLILLILGWVFVPFYLRSNVFTMPEFLERRFSRGSAVYLASISIIAYVLTKISVHLWAAAIVLKGVVGWSPLQAALILV